MKWFDRVGPFLKVDFMLPVDAVMNKPSSSLENHAELIGLRKDNEQLQMERERLRALCDVKGDRFLHEGSRIGSARLAFSLSSLSVSF